MFGIDRLLRQILNASFIILLYQKFDLQSIGEYVAFSGVIVLLKSFSTGFSDSYLLSLSDDTREVRIENLLKFRCYLIAISCLVVILMFSTTTLLILATVLMFITSLNDPCEPIIYFQSNKKKFVITRFIIFLVILLSKIFIIINFESIYILQLILCLELATYSLCQIYFAPFLLSRFDLLRKPHIDKSFLLSFCHAILNISFMRIPHFLSSVQLLPHNVLALYNLAQMGYELILNYNIGKILGYSHQSISAFQSGWSSTLKYTMQTNFIWTISLLILGVLGISMNDYFKIIAVDYKMLLLSFLLICTSFLFVLFSVIAGLFISRKGRFDILLISNLVGFVGYFMFFVTSEMDYLRLAISFTVSQALVFLSLVFLVRDIRT
jgi:hypothetical protein